MNCECCMNCYKIDACYGRCDFKCSKCSYNQVKTDQKFTFRQASEELTKVININYGDNTMSFDKNGDIKINDRLLENDKEIVDTLRKLLKLK